jgi:hypothetical protein
MCCFDAIDNSYALRNEDTQSQVTLNQQQLAPVVSRLTVTRHFYLCGPILGILGHWAAADHGIESRLSDR